MAIIKQQTTNVLGGTLTFYLVATAWAAARRGDGKNGRFRLGCAAGGSCGRSSRSDPWFSRMLLHSGVFGAQRIGRHLWRMCLALLIAAVSFFPGQVKLFPESVRAIKILYTPQLLLIAMLIFWLFRVRFGKAYRRKVVPAPSAAS